MAHEQPAAMIDDGSGNRVDRHNLRTAAWGGLIGTALEQYDFVIYGTATAIVFNQIFFPNVDAGRRRHRRVRDLCGGLPGPAAGRAVLLPVRGPAGPKFVLVATLFLMGISTFVIGALPSYAAGRDCWRRCCWCCCGCCRGSAPVPSRRVASCCSPRPPRRRSAAGTPRWCSWAPRRAPRWAPWPGSWSSCSPTSRCSAGAGGWCSSPAIFVTIAAYVLRRRLRDAPVFEQAKREQEQRAGADRLADQERVHRRAPTVPRAPSR